MQKLDEALLAMPRGIKECTRRTCMAEIGQQLSIRQNYSKILEVDFHFTRNVFVAFPGRIGTWCLPIQHFLPCQVGTNQRHCIAFREQLQLQNKVSAKLHIGMVLIAVPWTRNGASFEGLSAASNNTAITSKKHCVLVTC